MARVIQSEFLAFVTGVLGEEGAAGIRVSGVEPTPQGPRVRYVVPDKGQIGRVRGDSEATKRAAGVLLPRADDVCEAASRYVALRWRDSPEPRPVPRDSFLALMDAYPAIYDAPTETGDGWHWLLAMLAEWLRETGLSADFRVAQVKEKFGTLRFYCSSGEGEAPMAGRVVSATEWLSGAVCETCGAPGSVRPGGWVKTACDEHAKR